MGGRKSLGVTLQFIRVCEYLNERISNNKHCVLALLDVSKAFDRMNRARILQKLSLAGIAGNLLNTISAFLTERQQLTTIDGHHSEKVTTDLGSPQGSALSMFLFLVYFDDNIQTAVNTDYGVFVDDEALWVHGKRMPTVINNINNTFKKLHKWSLQNSVVFAAEKFHLLDLTTPQPNRSKKKITFGGVKQKFQQTAPYLGILVDRLLNLRPAMRERTRLAKQNTWRIFNHSNHETGASPRTLLHIFKTYVISILQYGSSCWIFRARTITTSGGKSNQGYGRVWGECETLYNSCVKASLGVKIQSADLAVLNIAGQWPLDFLLAYHAANWYYKIMHNMAGKALYDQYNYYKTHDDLWNQTTFYRPADNFIKEMGSPDNLLHIQPLHKFKSTLKEKINTRLSAIWSKYPKANFTKSIIPNWTNQQPASHMYSKRASTRQLQMLTGHFPCNDYLFTCNKSATRQCRHGCPKAETIKHLLIECEQFKTIRNKLIQTCRQLYIPFTTKNILTNPTIQLATQEFLHKLDIG